MKIFGRVFTAKELPGKAFLFSLIIFRASCLFKNPILLIKHFLKGTSPKKSNIKFRNGSEVKLSSHKLDIGVLFQVFCKKIYQVEKDSVVIDIGANIGIFSLFAAFNGSRKVFAYEPNSEAYNCIINNISKNNLKDIIIPFKLGVTSESNETVKILKAASPQNSITYEKIGTSDNGYEFVNTISLNDIVLKQNIPFVDLLKLDCEGSEYDIISSTNETTFSKIKSIVVEYHNARVGEIISKLKKNGFYLEMEKHETTKMGMLWFQKH